MTAVNHSLSVPVVFADRFYMSERALAEIGSMGGCTWVDAKDGVDLANKINGSSSVKVIVSEYIPVNDLVLDRAPAVKGIISYGAGYDHIDVEGMNRRGVLVCNCRGETRRLLRSWLLAFSYL